MNFTRIAVQSIKRCPQGTTNALIATRTITSGVGSSAPQIKQHWIDDPVFAANVFEQRRTVATSAASPNGMLEASKRNDDISAMLSSTPLSGWIEHNGQLSFIP
jgi:hypothetical protein